jgi:hypothetical protein
MKVKQNDNKFAEITSKVTYNFPSFNNKKTFNTTLYKHTSSMSGHIIERVLSIICKDCSTLNYPRRVSLSIYNFK